MMKCKIKIGSIVHQGMRPPYEWPEKLKDVELFIHDSFQGELTCTFPEKDLHLIGDCCDIYIDVNEDDVIMIK